MPNIGFKSRNDVRRVIAATRRVEQMRDDRSGRDTRNLASVPVHAIFRATLEQTGGSAGNKTTPCSFTYTVKTLAGDTIGTGKAPEWPSRSENGKRFAATSGLCYFDMDGAVQIAHAHERVGTGACA